MYSMSCHSNKGHDWSKLQSLKDNKKVVGGGGIKSQKLTLLIEEVIEYKQ